MTDTPRIWEDLLVKCSAAERRVSELALRESEQRFRELLNQVEKVSVQGYAPDGTTLYWNEGSRHLYGYKEEEALGRNLLDLIIPPEMRSEVAKEIEKMARTGEAVPASELCLMRKDGSRVTVYSSHCIVTRPGGQQELFCIDIDLSEIRRAEQERERLRAQLAQAQKMESVGRLAGGVAHDFNNMLSVILGHTELARVEAASDAPLRAHLSEIRTAAERSADLVRQLLAFASRQAVTPRNLDLNETVSAMLSMLRRIIGENIDLVWRPGANLDPVCMDPAQIDQMLANLVVNARDAIESVGRIEIATLPLDVPEKEPSGSRPRGVVIQVRDDGHGMDAATQAQIFEPFFTTKGMGQGTGLGLATVYGIVKQNHGTIEVDSSPGRGTTFTIALPAASGAVEEIRKSPGELEELPRGDETILLVEDESAIAMMVRDMLEGLGYRLLVASNPAEALRIAEGHGEELDLVLIDVILPGMNGSDLARMLVSRYPQLRALFMSGHTTDVLSKQGVRSHQGELIRKPFSLAELALKLREVLD
jgi:PAS domain S-box-containing protein